MTQASESAVIIRGTRRGLSVTIGEGEWQELLSELDTRLAQGTAFFSGSRVNLQAGRHEINQEQLRELIGLLKKHKVELASLQTLSRPTAEAAQALQVRLALAETASPQTTVRPVDQDASDGILVHRTVRSGQSLRHAGHVVVIGDVNPGAEVIAGGDIVVWGKARGVLHAGAVGDEGAVVCALELAPAQLRIGPHISVSPERHQSIPKALSPHSQVQPETASVVDGQIVVVPWGSR
jgi:septum site-determining protein MinC